MARLRPIQDIKTYMMLRLAFLFLVLISTVFYESTAVLNLSESTLVYYAVFFTFLMTTLFIYQYSRASRSAYFLTSQFAYDLIFTSILIYISKSNESFYAIFYFMNIVFAAIIFQGRGALLTAILCGALFIAVQVTRSGAFTGERLFSTMIVPTAMLAIGLLSGQLVEELQKSRVKISRLEHISEEIVNALDSGLITTNNDGKITAVNKTGLELLGRAEEFVYENSILGRPLDEIIGSINADEKAQIRQLRLKERLHRFLISSITLDENNKMVVFRDLSEILDLEEKLRRQERLASVGQLAAGVAHEIRNPIASISGSAQLLNEEDNIGTKELKRLTQIIINESERVDRLVKKLLEFAKPGSLKREDIELSELLINVGNSVRSRSALRENNISLDLHIEEGLRARGSVDQFKEVFENLITNAIQALTVSRSANKKITVSAKKNNEQIIVVIKDNGIGIPKETLGRIFDPFFTTKSEGTGLGLTQANKIVSEVGGYIEVESIENSGTDFKIVMPA